MVKVLISKLASFQDQVQHYLEDLTATGPVGRIIMMYTGKKTDSGLFDFSW
jgi:hypothetical protein